MITPSHPQEEVRKQEVDRTIKGAIVLLVVALGFWLVMFALLAAAALS